MNRINEKLAWKRIYILTPVFFLSFALFGASVRIDNIIGGVFFMCLSFASVILLCLCFYSLGWEYKRMSLEEDASRDQDASEVERE